MWSVGRVIVGDGEEGESELVAVVRSTIRS